MPPEDEKLLLLMSQALELRKYGIAVAAGERYGVVVLDQGKAVGKWAFHQGYYRWRYLANYAPLTAAGDEGEAVLLTIRMALRRAWHDPRGKLGSPPPQRQRFRGY